MGGRVWSVGVGGLLVGAVGAWWLAGSAQSPEQAAARAGEPEASWVTAAVERRVLSSTVIQRGDVRAEVALSVGVPVSVEGTPVVTQRPVGVGEAVEEGVRVLEVSGRPVFVLGGEVPVYRSLRPGMAGPDVAELQEALERLGFSPDSDGVFGEATKEAVAALYEGAGYEPVPAFEAAAAEIDAAERAVAFAEVAASDARLVMDGLGDGGEGSALLQAQVGYNQASRGLDAARADRVAAVRLAEEQYNALVRDRDRLAADPTTTAAALDAANLQIAQAEGALAQTRRSTADAVTGAEESLQLAAAALAEAREGREVTRAERDLALATDALARAEDDLAAVIARNGPTVPQGEVVFMARLPARVQALDSGSVQSDGGGIGGGGGGSSGSSTGSLVELSGGDLVVDMTVRSADIGFVRVGLELELLDEVTSKVYPATVSALADDPVVGIDGQLGYPAVATPDVALPDSLTRANLRVTITTASTTVPTLVVPLAAITSAADGTTRVSLVDEPNDADPVDVEVVAGLSADGFVAIEPVDPDALQVDDLVVVG